MYIKPIPEWIQLVIAILNHKMLILHKPLPRDEGKEHAGIGVNSGTYSQLAEILFQPLLDSNITVKVAQYLREKPGL